MTLEAPFLYPSSLFFLKLDEGSVVGFCDQPYPKIALAIA